MTTRGRLPGQGKVPGSGRQKKSLDRGERQLVTSQMAADLLTVYQKLGGVKWLLKFAEDNPAEFLRQGLSRLFPAAPKDDETPGGTYNTVNFNLDMFEASRRVCFALNAGIAAQRELERPVAEVAPREAYQPPLEPVAACHIPEDMRPPLLEPEPTLDADRERWVQELDLTDDQRRDKRLVEQTKAPVYHGSSAEQGRGPVRQSTATTRKPTTVNEIRRRQLL